MPRRKMRALVVGDAECLSDNFWLLHSVLYDKDFNVDGNFDTIYKLTEGELVYLYWELVHTNVISKLIKMNVRVFKEYLVDEYMNRKYKRGRYSEKNSEKIDD